MAFSSVTKPGESKPRELLSFRGDPNNYSGYLRALADQKSFVQSPQLNRKRSIRDLIASKATKKDRTARKVKLKSKVL
jgi:hypothetical protein